MPEPDERMVLPPAHAPAKAPSPVSERRGLDWSVLLRGILDLIVHGKTFAGQLEASTQTAPDDVLVGKVGIVTARIAAGRTGEIRLSVRGGTQDYIACARAGVAESMEVNSPAEVVAFMPPNTVYVKPSVAGSAPL